ncbi:hypothetical protein [Microtetraspora malaysiensis]|uniref:Uncharacterized protein n=1 Tax=Microtetraspora malaysiensis TaxID=161358 RepID=A0ABW6T0V8_9ACTN
MPKADLKELLDAYTEAAADDFIEKKFDLRFFTWADLWADKNLTPRLDDHFDRRLNTRLDTLVQARVANRIDDRIDRRIKQWLIATRTPAEERPTAEDPQPLTEKPSPPPGPEEGEPAETLVTAAELVELLGDVKIGTDRVRAAAGVPAYMIGGVGSTTRRSGRRRTCTYRQAWC